MVEVAVKALEFDSGLCISRAEHYAIEDNGANWTTDRYWLSYLGMPLGKFDTWEAARSFAQADFETRVRSCLSTPPEGKQEAIEIGVLDILSGGLEEIIRTASSEEADRLSRCLQTARATLAFAANAQARSPFKMLVDRDRLRAMIEQSPDDEECEAGTRHPEAPEGKQEAVDGSDYAGLIEPHDDVERGIAVIRAAYDFDLSQQGVLIGLVAGDQGWHPRTSGSPHSPTRARRTRS